MTIDWLHYWNMILPYFGLLALILVIVQFISAQQIHPGAGAWRRLKKGFVSATPYAGWVACGVVILALVGRGCPGPVPVPPDPPGPGPGPAPIVGSDMKVLVVRESKDSDSDIYTSTKVLKYLGEHCVKVSGQPAFRFLDPNQTVTDPMWKAALARPRTSVPWVVLTTTKATYEGPLTAKTPDEFVEWLKKYGGP